MTLQGMSSAKLGDSRSKLRAAVSKLRVVQSRSDEGLARKKNQGSIVRTHILHAFHTHRSAKQVRVVRTHRSKSNEQQCSHRPHLRSSVAQHAPCFGRRENPGVGANFGTRCQFTSQSSVTSPQPKYRTKSRPAATDLRSWIAQHAPCVGKISDPQWNAAILCETSQSW